MCNPCHTHAVIVVRELEAREAQAVVGPHGVFTGTVATRLSVALINIYKYIKCPSWTEQWGKQSSHTIGCGSAPLTHAHCLVCGRLEAVVAEAPVAALGINALSVAAHVGNLLALVAVWQNKRRGWWQHSHTDFLSRQDTLTVLGLKEVWEKKRICKKGQCLY